MACACGAVLTRLVISATDGTTFEDRDAYRKYEFATQYTFKDKQGETLVRNPGQVDG